MTMNNHKIKIAVVEDEEALQRVMVEWLKLSGFSAFGITTGDEAVEIIPKTLPDLILLDIILPGINGFEVMRELKQNPATAKIPVIVLTNLADENEKKQALEQGAREYLVKADYDFQTVQKIIKQTLNS